MRNKRPKNPNRIDKSGLADPVSPRYENRKVLDLMEFEDCSACGTTPCIGAHVRTGGTGGGNRKPDDDLALPLCGTCHDLQEKNIGSRWWIENVLNIRFVFERGDSHEFVEDVLLRHAVYEKARIKHAELLRKLNDG